MAVIVVMPMTTVVPVSMMVVVKEASTQQDGQQGDNDRF